jgi:hypothetical protein
VQGFKSDICQVNHKPAEVDRVGWAWAQRRQPRKGAGVRLWLLCAALAPSSWSPQNTFLCTHHHPQSKISWYACSL